MSQRRRHTDADKARWLEEFETVGGSAAAFCRERGLPYQSFINWRLTAAEPKEVEPTPEFIEIDFAPRPASPAPAAAGALVELDFGDGLVLRIRSLHSHLTARP